MATKKKQDTEKGTKKRDRDWFDDDFDGSLKRCEENKGLSKKTVVNPDESGKNNRQGASTSAGQRPGAVQDVLPLRLFSEDKIPGGGRINTYSKLDYLLNLVEVLDGTDELDFILDSQFGKLFEIQIRKAVLSGKLVHQFLCRSLRTKKRHEIWVMYGGKPICFSLKEFGYLTGLKCDQYPNPDPMAPAKATAVKKDEFWNSLIGKREHCHVADILDMLRFDRQRSETERMSRGRRLRLALIALVEGVLIPQSWSRPVSRECVEVAKSIDGFMAYPWGRRSFELTMEMITYHNSANPTEQSLRDKLSSSHLTARGFIISFQLLILATVPRLCDELPNNPRWLANFLEAAVDDPPMQTMPKFRRFHNDNINKIEIDEELEVVSMLGEGFALGTSDFSWHNEVKDMAVDKMVGKIRSGHRFSANDWLYVATDKEVQPHESKEGRETVLGLPKTKQLTIKKLLKGKGKVGAEVKDDNSSVDVSQVMDKDRIIMEARGEIFAAVDVVLARLKSQMPDGQGYIGQSGRMADKPMSIGGMSGGKKFGDGLFASGSGECRTPTKLVGTESVGLEKVQGDDIDIQLKQVVADLDKEEQKASEVLEQENRELEADCEAKDIVKDNQGAECVVDVDMTTSGNALVGEEEVVALTGVNNQFVVDTEQIIVDEVPLPSERQISKDKEPKNLAEDHTETDDQVVATGCGDELMVDDFVGALSTNVDDILKDDERRSGSNSVKSDEETDDEQGDNKAVVDDGLGKPLRSKRERKAPKKFSDDDLHLGNPGGSGEGSMSSDESGSKDEALKRQFVAKLAGYRQSHFDVEGQSLPRNFFRDIYKPKNHVSGEHLEFMLSCVWRRLAGQLIGQRIVILDSWFTQLLKTTHEKYSKPRKVDDPFIWNNSLCKYVAGEVGRRPGNVAWLVDVDQIYAPMHLGKNHWVAIYINLREGKITIYDSNINLHSEAKLGRLVKHLTEIMPLVVHEVAPVNAAPYEPTRKYEHYRPVDVSQNPRGGDCGPLAVKFIELSCQGQPVDGITDEEVDNLRMMYAMEVFREFVEPFP